MTWLRKNKLSALLGLIYAAGLLASLLHNGARGGATYLVATGATLAWWFVWMYRRENWRQYQEGRHVMQFTLMVAIILSLATEVRIFGPYKYLEVVALFLYGWLVWLLASRIRLMRRANRRDKAAR